MNNTHKSKEQSKSGEGLQFCNWAAMPTVLKTESLSFLNFNENPQKPFNTIHWIEKTQQILQNNQGIQLYIWYFSIYKKKFSFAIGFNYEGGIKEYKN